MHAFMSNGRTVLEIISMFLPVRENLIILDAGNEYILVESVSGCMTKNGELDWTGIAIWNATFRPLWCIGVGAIVVLCDLNYGFLINWFLSCKVRLGFIYTAC